eukprot:TRINITY_DN7382_c0_g1_i2.p1 TRINITY_DN7382_c0_g1~~TRINITY_DN7382_c0_g1_i2.p1  ORF type:complete len:1117 (-),score=192.21 TRINITY_DN7382_c0_g1_i2:83-3433(-)
MNGNQNKTKEKKMKKEEDKKKQFAYKIEKQSEMNNDPFDEVYEEYNVTINIGEQKGDLMSLLFACLNYFPGTKWNWKIILGRPNSDDLLQVIAKGLYDLIDSIRFTKKREDSGQSSQDHIIYEECDNEIKFNFMSLQHHKAAIRIAESLRTRTSPSSLQFTSTNLVNNIYSFDFDISSLKDKVHLSFDETETVEPDYQWETENGYTERKERKVDDKCNKWYATPGSIFKFVKADIGPLISNSPSVFFVGISDSGYGQGFLLKDTEPVEDFKDGLKKKISDYFRDYLPQIPAESVELKLLQIDEKQFESGKYNYYRCIKSEKQNDKIRSKNNSNKATSNETNETDSNTPSTKKEGPSLSEQLSVLLKIVDKYKGEANLFKYRDEETFLLQIPASNFKSREQRKRGEYLEKKKNDQEIEEGKEEAEEGEKEEKQVPPPIRFFLEDVEKERVLDERVLIFQDRYILQINIKYLGSSFHFRTSDLPTHFFDDEVPDQWKPIKPKNPLDIWLRLHGESTEVNKLRMENSLNYVVLIKNKEEKINYTEDLEPNKIIQVSGSSPDCKKLNDSRNIVFIVSSTVQSDTADKYISQILPENKPARLVLHGNSGSSLWGHVVHHRDPRIKLIGVTSDFVPKRKLECNADGELQEFIRPYRMSVENASAQVLDHTRHWIETGNATSDMYPLIPILKGSEVIWDAICRTKKQKKGLKILRLMKPCRTCGATSMLHSVAQKAANAQYQVMVLEKELKKDDWDSCFQKSKEKDVLLIFDGKQYNLPSTRPEGLVILVDVQMKHTNSNSSSISPFLNKTDVATVSTLLQKLYSSSASSIKKVQENIRNSTLDNHLFHFILAAVTNHVGVNNWVEEEWTKFNKVQKEKILALAFTALFTTTNATVPKSYFGDVDLPFGSILFVDNNSTEEVSIWHSKIAEIIFDQQRAKMSLLDILTITMGRINAEKKERQEFIKSLFSSGSNELSKFAAVFENEDWKKIMKTFKKSFGLDRDKIWQTVEPHILVAQSKIERHKQQSKDSVTTAKAALEKAKDAQIDTYVFQSNYAASLASNKEFDTANEMFIEMWNMNRQENQQKIYSQALKNAKESKNGAMIEHWASLRSDKELLIEYIR